MKYDVKVPAVGESVTEATIGSWQKKNGEAVKRNDVLLLLETDKASVEVVAEQDGVLNISTQAGQTIPIGTVVGQIDSEGKSTVSAAPSAQATAAPSSKPQPASEKANPAAAATPVQPRSEPAAGASQHLSPAVQKIVTEKGIDPATVAGTGKDGRLTKGDVLNVQPARPAPEPGKTTAVPASTPAPAMRGPSKQGDERRVPMTTIRKRIAERLVFSQQSTATLTTFNEIDMSKVMALRSRYKDQFKEKYGVGLGFMGFFVKATIEALKAWPAVNARVDGNDLVYHNFHNIGVAVGTDKGLIVPVIKDADNLSVAGVEMAIRDFAVKARDGKIGIDDLSGGTFTISNGGVYGSLMSTPILNPPQSGILGMHKIEERAVVINGKVEVRPMMYVALSYDHRVIDGKEAVSFLVKIKEGVEDPERLLIEI